MLQDDKAISYYKIEDGDKLQSSLPVKEGGGVNTFNISKNITNECDPL